MDRVHQVEISVIHNRIGGQDECRAHPPAYAYGDLLGADLPFLPFCLDYNLIGLWRREHYPDEGKDVADDAVDLLEIHGEKGDKRLKTITVAVKEISPIRIPTTFDDADIHIASIPFDYLGDRVLQPSLYPVVPGYVVSSSYRDYTHLHCLTASHDPVHDLVHRPVSAAGDYR